MFAASSLGPKPALASPADRLLAQILDTLVAYSGPGMLLFGLSQASPVRGFGTLSVLVVLAATGYILFADALENGQSLGKRVIGIAVIDERAGPDRQGRRHLRQEVAPRIAAGHLALL